MSAPYRPPGRSNRSGRSNVDNDVFEGLPVKQWGQAYSRVSLAPPATETQEVQDDKWADPPMPRDYQLLHPWTQHLLRLARSGKVGTKRKQDSDSHDEDRPDDEVNEETAKGPSNDDERGYIAKKWKHTPEHALVPEHKHFEFLAKRRRGMSSLYAPEQQNGAPIVMRKTKVQRADANGEIALYEVLVPEGQTVEGEVTDTTELPDVKPVVAAPGTVIEGVGVANEEGVLVAEHLKPPGAPRRNRPPPKKKGGPGRGKKRVTFTNPDGSTYTTIVPNATKIVPQPGQIVKHVAKGEEASADVTAEEAAAAAATNPEQNGEEGSGSDESNDEGDDDDDREEGEVSDDDAPGTGAATPATKPQTPAKSNTPALTTEQITSQPMEDVQMAEPGSLPEVKADVPVEVIREEEEKLPPPVSVEEPKPRDPSSSPDVPLATNHSRTGSLAEPPPVSLNEDVPPSTEVAVVEDTPVEPLEDVPKVEEPPTAATISPPPNSEPTEAPDAPDAPNAPDAKTETSAEKETEKVDDADDLLGNLEKYTQPAAE